MPTREEIRVAVERLLAGWVRGPTNLWVPLYRLLLDYEHGVPRITDSNRLRRGIWRDRALQVETVLAQAIGCNERQVENHVDVFMRQLYEPRAQRMNPVGIAFQWAIILLCERFGGTGYNWQMEAKAAELFPRAESLPHERIDIAVFDSDGLYAIVSSKWGLRHDRIKDLWEEADAYKVQQPGLKFFVVTNEFDKARLAKVVSHRTIDGVFHIAPDLLRLTYAPWPAVLNPLRDLIELFPLFP